jgi:hypothetical protein
MSTWQIGESGTEVALNDDLEGEVTFTVTNGGTAQDRSVLTITALDGAAESWCTVAEPQRLVPQGQSATYLCKVKIPPGTAPGTYGIQAMAYSADRDPGETSVTSKRVGIVVPKVEEEDKGTPWWAFVITAAVMLVAITVVLWLVFKDDGGLGNAERPTIEGTPEVLQNLVATPGEWSDEQDLTFTFQWQRCNGDGDDCEAIDGATLPAYPVGADDLARTLRVEVTASNADESATARSDATDPVAPTQVVALPVPPVVGLTRSAAISALSANFQVVTLTAGDPVDSCDPVVESQAPSPGSSLNTGEQVSISTRPGSPIIFCIADIGELVDSGLIIVDRAQASFTADQVQEFGDQVDTGP